MNGLCGPLGRHRDGVVPEATVGGFRPVDLAELARLDQPVAVRHDRAGGRTVFAQRASHPGNTANNFPARALSEAL